MTTIVHIGDFHAAQGPRNADRYRALDQILDETLELPTLGAYCWPGDLFDAASHVDDRNAIDARLKRMADRAPVLIVEGNHDRPGDLRGFANLSGAHPIVVVDQEPRLVSLRLATGEDAVVWCLPYPHRNGLVSAGVAHGDLVAVAQAYFEPMFLQAAADLEAARAEGALTWMLFHANVAGAITSTGQPNVGREVEITRALLDRLGGIYKGGNHIHRPQQIDDTTWYAGSCSRNDYGEREEKRYLLVHVNDIFGFTVESRPLDLPPMVHVDGMLTREGFTPDEDPGDTDGADVRVRYRYQASERAVLDEAGIRERFASARRLKVESVAIPDRELRAPAVAVAKSLVDKLAAMRPEGTLPESVAAKVAALEAQERDQVLDSVRTWLTSVEAGEDVEVAA